MQTAQALRSTKLRTFVACVVLILLVPFFVTAVFRLPGTVGFPLAPVACLAVGLLLRRVPEGGRAMSWSWLGACVVYGLALCVLVLLLAAGGVPED